MRAIFTNPIAPVLCLLLACVGVQAQELYSGTAPVDGQSDAQRRAAVPLAFEHVLRKLSGLRELPPSAELDQAKRDAASILLAYQYLEKEQQNADGTISRSLQLKASFLPARMDQWVRDLALPRWRVGREPVVMWVVVDDGLGRTLMPLEYQYALDQMESVARSRGLPMSWPGMSEELKDQLDLQLLWGGYTDQLVTEGSRSEGVVIAAARREGPEWNVRWTFSHGAASESWRTRSTALEAALIEGTHGLVDRAAAVASIAPDAQGDWLAEIVVREIHSANGYARCLGYLEDLNLVDGVSVLELSPQGLKLQLALNANPEYLYKAFLEDGVLMSGEQPGIFLLTDSLRQP